MKRILIANRGEIAIRIARSVKDLGMKAVGICSDDDLDSLHLSKMDEVHSLDSEGVSAYLDIKKIVAIARENKIDAIHPGYGFLSENPKFASAIKRAGLIFIGPEERTLKLFGDKVKARELAQKHNVPVVEGSNKDIDLKEAKKFFSSLKKHSSVIIKAKSGGGGRGLRVVNSEDDLKEALIRASSEAKIAFGSEEVYIEEYLNDSRHVEIQIIGDGLGNVSHLYDRECTVQRRYQKIIEVAPSPTLTNEVRLELIDAALRMTKAIKYKGLCTVEFLLDNKSNKFCFIEGNARLQVEHTVTESILGLDIVKAQIQIAFGKTLKQIKYNQENIPSPRGFAIQARVNMEVMDADGNIKPSGGIFSKFDLPAGPGVRTDTCGYTGYASNPSFDSLVAKVITFSPEDNYSKAIKRLYRGLCEFNVEGVVTNLQLLKNILTNKDFIQNNINTNFIEKNIATLVSSKEHKNLYGLVDVKSSELGLAGARSDTLDPLAVLDHGKGGHKGITQTPDVLQINNEQLPEGMTSLNAPMQGMIVNFGVKQNEEVWVGKPLLVMEAMKMEHVVLSEVSGTVKKINVNPQDTVLEGHSLIHIEVGVVDNPDADLIEEIDLDWIRPDLEEALQRKQASHDVNRPEAVIKRHEKGHRTARENIEDLCDEGSFVEYGSVVIAAQRRRRSEEDLIKNTTGDGMVCGLGHVNGDKFSEQDTRVMAMSYDYMVLAGTQGKLNHAKKDRMFEIAEDNRLPTILFAEGGGGRPGDTDTSGVAGLDCLAFTYFAQLSGLVPVIGITTGYCFAGNAVLLGCCDVIIATEGSNIGIGGPAMIEGGGLGVFKPSEVGPMDVQVPNGVVDIAVKDEKEAVEVAKKYLSYFQGSIKKWKAPDARKLRFAVPENRLRYYDMRKVIEGIADIDSTLELRKDWAPGIITSFIRIEGKPVGVVANNPGHLSGAIDSPGADKGSRFIQLCDAFDIPVLSLIDCPGIMVGPESEKSALVRHASRMFVVGANIQTPLMSVVIRKAYGLGAQAMAGGSFKIPLFTVTWPTGEFGGMGLEGAVKLGYRKELEAIKDPKERIKAYEKMVADSYKRGKAVNMASHFELDDVIDPAETRNWILGGLKSLPPKEIRTKKRRPNIDTW
tara:strand:- start:23 stop:3403 length:3381 start_codon:yes stop_codon:yes gene_type:complete